MTTRVLGLVAAAIMLTTSSSVGQSSQFGRRGLGIPTRTLSARSFALAGAFGLFDPESNTNPAALGRLGVMTVSFTSAQNWRRSKNPFGANTAKDNRFPQIAFAGPIPRHPFVLGISLGTYTDRSFGLSTVDTALVGGTPVEVNDTVTSRGGISDLRLGVAWQLSPSISIGVGLHGLVGSLRIDSRRAFSDTTFASAVSRSNITFGGVGVSAGAVVQFSERLAVAGVARFDGNLDTDRDSTGIGKTDLPSTFMGAVYFSPISKLALTVQGTRRNWSVANQDLIDQGGIGARNTYEVAGGLEFFSNPKNPFHLPLRVGLRYGTLPFPLQAGGQPNELGVSIGSGFRFTQGRGGVDIAVERITRDQGVFSERATVLTVGLSIRP